MKWLYSFFSCCFYTVEELFWITGFQYLFQHNASLICDLKQKPSESSLAISVLSSLNNSSASVFSLTVKVIYLMRTLVTVCSELIIFWPLFSHQLLKSQWRTCLVMLYYLWWPWGGNTNSNIMWLFLSGPFPPISPQSFGVLVAFDYWFIFIWPKIHSFGLKKNSVVMD